METAGSRKKALLQVSVELFWTVGVFSFLALFFVLPDFRYIKAIACIYEAILLFWVGWIPESIRWLLSKGKYDEARDLLRHACEYNRKNTRSPTKKEVDDDLARVKVEHKIKRLLQHFEDQEVELKEQRKKSLFDLWFSPMAPICLILYICWFTNSLINYGTAYNQSNYGSNLWLSSIMFELSAFSGMVVLFWLIERIDRRWFARFAYFFMFVGCASLTISFYVEGLQRGSMIRQIFSSDPINPVRLVFGMLLKITGNFSYHIIYLLSVESYPTIMRQLGVGTCSVASRFASILAPFLHELGILAGLPTVFMIFTSFSFFALILIGFVPETRGKEIPNTLNECLQRREEAKSKNKT